MIFMAKFSYPHIFQTPLTPSEEVQLLATEGCSTSSIDACIEWTTLQSLFPLSYLWMEKIFGWNTRMVWIAPKVLRFHWYLLFWLKRAEFLWRVQRQCKHHRPAKTKGQKAIFLFCVCVCFCFAFQDDWNLRLEKKSSFEIFSSNSTTLARKGR